MTQCERIMQYLDSNGSISAAEAMTELGIYRLAARINELTNAGFRINKKMVKAKNRFGEDVHFMRYSLD